MSGLPDWRLQNKRFSIRPGGKTIEHNINPARAGYWIVQDQFSPRCYPPAEARRSGNNYLHYLEHKPAGYHRNFEGRRNPAVIKVQQLCSCPGCSQPGHTTQARLVERMPQTSQTMAHLT